MRAAAREYGEGYVMFATLARRTKEDPVLVSLKIACTSVSRGLNFTSMPSCLCLDVVLTLTWLHSDVSFSLQTSF